MVTCPICGRNTPEGKFCEHCGAQLVAAQFYQQMSQPSVLPGHDQTPNTYNKNIGTYAGFWVRFFAWIIDSILLFVVLLAICFFIIVEGGIDTNQVNGQYSSAMDAAMWASFLIYMVIYWLYSAYLESSYRKATFGKVALGLIVIDHDGKQITFKQGTIRWIGKIISGFIFCVGYIIIGLTEKKQGFHDMIASTYVVYKNTHEAR